MNSCADCLFFLEHDGREGICRRYPPEVYAQISFRGGMSKTTVWRNTLKIDWCGEWKSKDESEEER